MKSQVQLLLADFDFQTLKTRVDPVNHESISQFEKSIKNGFIFVFSDSFSEECKVRMRLVQERSFYTIEYTCETAKDVIQTIRQSS